MADLGLLLKREREARNISIEEIASSTKIVSRYLEALEADRFDVMPGGFFIKGIIRTYSRYLGLDEEEVLSRYRAAGVLGENAHSRRQPSPASAPPPSPQSPPSTSPSPASPASAPPEAPLSATSLAPSTKKKLLYWFVVASVIVLLLALVLLLWTAIRPKPAPEPVTDTLPIIEQPQASTPVPQDPALPPAPQEEWRGVTMEISFDAETWMQVLADGILKIDGLFPPGTKAKARADTELLIHVGNAGGFSFLLNGRPAKPLGRTGAVIKDIRITADNFKDFLQAPVQSPDPPAD